MNIVQFIIPIVFLVFAVLGGTFLVFPKYQSFVGFQESIKEKENRIQKGEERLVELRMLEREIEAQQDTFAKIDAAIPGDIALPGVYHDLQRMGSESGLVLVGVKFTEEQFDDELVLAKTNIDLKLEGSYSGVKNFLLQVKSSERMFNAQSAILEVQDNITGILSVQVHVEAYAAQTL
jgi:Tfp pilus assembly protein PilO